MPQQRATLPRRDIARLIAALPLALAARPAAAQNAAWSMATEYPATTVSGQGIAFFASRLAVESGGRLAVATSYDGSKSADIVSAVRDGKLAAGCAFAGALGRIDPLFLLPSLPFVTTSENEARRLLDKARGAYARTFEREAQRLLYATPWPATGLWAKKPIATLADLAGLKLRVYDATGVAVFSAAGAAAVDLSFADAMPRLSDGSIEAVLSSGDGGAGRKLWEYLPYFTEIGYAFPLSFATLGTALQAPLAPDLKAAVDRAAEATQQQQWARLATRVEENYTRLRANKVAITTADKVSPELRAALAKAAASAIAAWKRDAGPEAAALLG
jgi:TRAP-type C4-dicarboxylate transport system substrate-binding protein